MIALAIPLSFALGQIARESLVSSQAQKVIQQQFGPDARVSNVEVDYKANPLQVSARVFTPEPRPKAQDNVQRMLSDALGRSVQIDIEQVRVSTGAADAAQLSASRFGETRKRGTEISQELALVAGTKADDVLIDEGKRLARVRAVPLPGASADTYRQLEARVAASNSAWQIELVPPSGAELPNVPPKGAREDLAKAVETVAWSSNRLQLPVRVLGDQSADVAKQLGAMNVQARAVRSAGAIRFEWDVRP